MIQTMGYVQVYNTFIPPHTLSVNQDIYYHPNVLPQLTPLTTYQCNATTSKSLLRSPGLPEVVIKIKLRKWNRIVHTLRKNTAPIERKILNCSPQGRTKILLFSKDFFGKFVKKLTHLINFLHFCYKLYRVFPFQNSCPNHLSLLLILLLFFLTRFFPWIKIWKC